MYNKILIKNKMNEILRGDTDMLARKYIGRSADNMRMKEKEKILADIYMSFNDALKKPKEVKSEVALRKEQIDNEMKDIRIKDRDELLGGYIKNYDPSISVEEKDEILGKIYDGLQDERNKLDKEPSIITPPEPPEKPKLTTLPDESVTVGAEVKPLSNTSGYSGEKRTPRGMTDLDIEANMKEILHGDTDTFLENNAEMYGFSYNPDMSAVEKEDILRCIYDTLEEERRKLKAGEYDAKPENPSIEEKTDTVSDEVSEKEAYITQIEHDMNEILHADRDYVIETYAPKYGIEYDDGYMSEKYKEQIINDIYSSADYDYKKALGEEIPFTFEAQSEKLQKMGQNAEYKHQDDIIVTINTYFNDYDAGVYDRYLEDVYNYNEVRKGLDYLDEELAYVDFLYNEIEPVANRAHSSKEANELRDMIIEREKFLKNVREKYVKKGKELAKHYGTEFSSVNKAETVNNQSIASWEYNPNISDMGRHYEDVNAGARLVRDGVLDEERAANLTYSKAQELDELNDVAETIFFSGFGGNAATEWFMTDEERQRYNIINYEQGGKAADEYYASIEQSLNDRKEEWMIQAAEKLAHDSRWQTTTGTILAAPLRAIISMYGNYHDKKTGKVSANSGDKQSQIFTDYARQKVAESLPEGWDTVYNKGVGFGDTVAIDLFSAMLCAGNPALTELTSTLLGSSSEMQQTVMEKLENGASDKEALKAGLEAGVIDIATGKFADSDKIFKVVNKYFPNVKIDKLNKKELKYVIDYIMQEIMKEIIT